MRRVFVPLLVFVLLVCIFMVGLFRDPREIPSPLIGKSAPSFALPSLFEPEVTIDNQSLLDQVTLVNIWASWCTSCIQEHPLLLKLANQHKVRLLGLNYKDNVDDAMAWLQRHGNPYTLIAFDQDGRTGIDWGVYGVPETFVIDATGVVRYKFTGPLTDEAIEKEIIPILTQIQGS